MCPSVVSVKVSSTTRIGESAEVNVSDHEYEVGHNKRKRPEIHRGEGVDEKRKFLHVV